MVHLNYFHEGNLLRGTIALISFIITKKPLHLYHHGNRFYNRYIYKTDKTKYLDDNVTGLKQKHSTEIGMRCSSGYDPINQMWNRYWKIARENFGRKRKPTGYIYLPGSKYLEAEGHLTMRSCLQEAFIYYVPRIGKYINKLELHNQCPTRIVKDKNY